MITPTRRDLAVAALTASVCLGLLGFIGQDRIAATVPTPKPIMGSMAFDWEKMVVKPTKIVPTAKSARPRPRPSTN